MKAHATVLVVEDDQEMRQLLEDEMREAGYDIASAHPKMLTEEMIEASDHVITMGCMEDPSCPAVLAEDDWGIDDPAGAPMPKVREIRDEIARRVRKLLREMGTEPVR